MIDTIGEALWNGTFIISLFVWGITFVLCRKNPLLNRITASALFALSAYLFLFPLSLEIILRDGLLGGDSRSTGLTALYRSSPGLIGLVATIPLIWMGRWVLRVREPRSPKTTDRRYIEP